MARHAKDTVESIESRIVTILNQVNGQRRVRILGLEDVRYLLYLFSKGTLDSFRRDLKTDYGSWHHDDIGADIDLDFSGVDDKPFLSYVDFGRFGITSMAGKTAFSWAYPDAEKIRTKTYTVTPGGPLPRDPGVRAMLEDERQEIVEERSAGEVRISVKDRSGTGGRLMIRGPEQSKPGDTHITYSRPVQSSPADPTTRPLAVLDLEDDCVVVCVREAPFGMATGFVFKDAILSRNPVESWSSPEDEALSPRRLAIRSAVAVRRAIQEKLKDIRASVPRMTLLRSFMVAWSRRPGPDKVRIPLEIAAQIVARGTPGN